MILYEISNIMVNTNYNIFILIYTGNDCTYIETGIKKINKIKFMLYLVKKYNSHIFQLDYFVDQVCLKLYIFLSNL